MKSAPRDGTGILAIDVNGQMAIVVWQKHRSLSEELKKPIGGWWVRHDAEDYTWHGYEPIAWTELPTISLTTLEKLREDFNKAKS